MEQFDTSFEEKSRNFKRQRLKKRFLSRYFQDHNLHHRVTGFVQAFSHTLFIPLINFLTFL